MNRKSFPDFLLAAFLITACSAAFLLTGCSSVRQARSAANPEGEPAAPNTTTTQGVAQLWSQRCSQCHYPRDAGTFSQDQWEIIMLHMRVRANLTAADHQAILEFLTPAKLNQ